MKNIRLFLLPLLSILWTLFSNAQTIAAGSGHTLVICNNNQVQAWGFNFYGQLGDGTNTDSYVPLPISSLSNIVSIAGGAAHTLALENNGIVWTCGDNNYGQLGNGTNTDSNIPVQVSAVSNITQIAGGWEHSLALRNDSTVWSWGYNIYGQLGNGNNTDSNIPVQVTGLTGITVIASGRNHSMVLKNDSTVWTWGWNPYGQLGNGTSIDSNIPVQVNGLTGIIAIAGGDGHTLALKSDGTVWSWGFNAMGQLGNGNNSWTNVPGPVTGLTGIIAIAAGRLHSLALRNDGTVWAWGSNAYGALGDGTFTNSNVPVQVTVVSGISSITGGGGGEHSVALKNDGTLWTWGLNGNGQLGNGTFANSFNVPAQVSGLCLVANTTLSTIVSSTNIICNGQCTGTATATPSNGTAPYTYSWNSIPVQTTQTATALCAGNYTVTVTDATFATTTASVVITQPTAITATSSQTNLACNAVCNGSASVVASGGTPAYTYSWAPNGGTAATATGLCAANYTCTITDSNGCPITQLFSITQPTAVSLTVGSTAENCGAGDGAAFVSASGGTPGYSFAWSNSSTNDTIGNLVAGSYSVTATDANGCAITQTVVVTNTGTAIANAGTSVTISTGQSTQLTGTGGVTYSWSPATGLSCNNCQNPMASPSVTTTYTLTISDANGCTATDTVTVFVDVACGEVYLPNAFSPNGDAQNDVLFVRGNCIKFLDFKIFNRFGEEVFYSNDPAKGWDGTWRGEKCEAATFTYFLRVTKIDDTQIDKQGTISLVK